MFENVSQIHVENKYCISIAVLMLAMHYLPMLICIRPDSGKICDLMATVMYRRDFLEINDIRYTFRNIHGSSFIVE